MRRVSPRPPPPSPLCRKTTTRRHVPHDRECLAGLRGQGCADVRLLWDWKGSGRRKRCAIEVELEVLTDLWGERREGAGGRVGVGIHAGAEGRSTAQVFHSSHPFRTVSHCTLIRSPFCTGHPPPLLRSVNLGQLSCRRRVPRPHSRHVELKATRRHKCSTRRIRFEHLSNCTLIRNSYRPLHRSPPLLKSGTTGSALVSQARVPRPHSRHVEK